MKEVNLRKRYLTYSVPKLKKLADDAFSIYIRTHYSKDGYCVCYTCGKRIPINETDAGHYVSRICGYLRYSEKNVFPQCKFCNRFKEGNKDEFTMKLIKDFGVEHLEYLNMWKHKAPQTANRNDLVDIIFTYRDKIKELEK
jgi:hypothetical protein